VYTPVISAFGRLRQEDLEFKVSLSYKRTILSQKAKTITKQECR
jgi:hypothetical protein